ncbi:hypothetical protein [Methanobrevibacter sp.]
MPITETPKIKIYKEDSLSLSSGEGGEIPIFIGVTANETPSANILKFSNYNDAKKSTAGGIGPEADTNTLLSVIKDFFEESKRVAVDDVGVPYIYAKDVGAASAETATNFTNPKEASKTKQDIQVEAYIFKQEDTPANIASVLVAIAESLKTDKQKGKPRIAYATVKGWTVTELARLTSLANGIKDSDVALVEYDQFGKTIARICCTPYYDEPGYYPYRSVIPGTFKERTDTVEETIQANGIIFNHDEKPGKVAYPKINLAVATSYVKPIDERPIDSLIHVNRNVNQLIRDAVEVVYPQLKRRETETYIQEVQADLDLLCANKIKKGYMLEGTTVTAVEYKQNPTQLKLKIKANPVNITGLIEATIYV